MADIEIGDYSDIDGYGSGYGTGSGYGYGGDYGYSDIDGYGSGYGTGSGYGDTDGYGSGYGTGSGYGYGSGYGSGSGSDDGSGYGYGSGTGSGYDNQVILRDYATAVSGALTGQWVLAEPNAEIKRLWIKAMGPDRFFTSLNSQVVHQDIDSYGNPRVLLRIPLADAREGYLQAVRVVCPTTGRVYHLGVTPHAKTCQDAVASTFGLRAVEYHPIRET